MVVEFTASTCTFCGGAVGTEAAEREKIKQCGGGMRGQKRKMNTEPTNCHLQVIKH